MGKPIIIKAVYDLTTPAFIGGMDSKRAEIRVPSFKGALRFWWRACVAATIRDVDELRQREAELFGSAQLGRSRLAIRSEPGQPRLLSVDSELKSSALAQHGGGGRRGPGRDNAYGAWYLAYGVVKQGGSTLVRQAIKPPWRVHLHMQLADFPLRPAESNRQPAPFDTVAARREITNALIALGLFGGLGSKSRKGYGSVALRELVIDGESCWKPPTTANGLAECIRTLYHDCGIASGSSEPEPKWTALSGHARHLLITPTRDVQAFDLLDTIGCELVRYRSWGKDGTILGNVKANTNFPIDHNIAKGKLDNCHPARVAFGLPHSYTGDGFSVTPAASGIDRRASPLFIHMHECQERPVAVLSFFPARFLPAGQERVHMRWSKPNHKSKQISLSPRPALWKPINEFLHKIKSANKTFHTMEINII